MIVTIGGKGKDGDMVYATVACGDVRAYGHSVPEALEDLKEKIDETYYAMIDSVNGAISDLALPHEEIIPTKVFRFVGMDDLQKATADLVRVSGDSHYEVGVEMRKLREVCCQQTVMISKLVHLVESMAT